MEEGNNPNGFSAFEDGEVEHDPHKDNFFRPPSMESTNMDRMVYLLHSNSNPHFHSNSNSNSNSGPFPYNGAFGEQAQSDIEENMPIQNSDETDGNDMVVCSYCIHNANHLNNVRRQQEPVQLPSLSDPIECFQRLRTEYFPASLLKVGSYTRVARNESNSDLRCRFSYFKKQLGWEMLEVGKNNKIETDWCNVVGLRATIKDDNTETLEIELNEPPLFWFDIDPNPLKHPIWHPSLDFTRGEASKFRRYYIEFRPGVLRSQLERLFRFDSRLSELSRRGYPRLRNPSFYHIPDPAHLTKVTNMCGFNVGRSLDPQINNKRPKITSPPRQFHPYPHTVPSPYVCHDLIPQTSETRINSQPGNGFQHPGITYPNSQMLSEEMIYKSELPFEAPKLILSEKANAELQRYRNLIFRSNERINQVSAFPSLSQGNAVVGAQFPSADNVTADGSQIGNMRRQQMVTMMDPSLLSRSSEAQTVNRYNDTAVPYTPQISYAAPPTQDANGKLTFPDLQQLLDEVNRGRGTYHSWKDNHMK